MEKSRKIISYMKRGDECIEMTNSGEIRIKPSHHEMSLSISYKPNSPIRRIGRLAADLPLLRLFLFLKANHEFVPDSGFPLVKSFPIFFTLDREFLNRSALDISGQLFEELSEKRDHAEANARESSLSLLYRMMKVIYNDKSFRSQIRKGRLPRGSKADELYARLFKKHSNDAMEFYEELSDLYQANQDVMERFEPVLNALKQSKTAERNHSLLKRGGLRNTNLNLFSDAMGSLEGLRILGVVTITTCLECLIRRKLDPYILIQVHPGRPEIPSICHKCSGTTLLTEIGLEIPSHLCQLFFEGHYLDIVIGETIAKSQQINRVYVHKKIDDNSCKTEIELDILAITDDEQALAIDVNITSERGEVFERANHLRNLTKDFPVSKLICLGSDPLLEEYSRQRHNVYVFHAKHLADLDRYVNEVIDE